VSLAIMTRILFLLVLLAVLAGTLGSGWLRGHSGKEALLEQAGDRLRAGLPPRLGPWRLVKTHETPREVAAVLQCVACLHGAYTNDQTGDTVVVALIAGPSGPVSVHTPEICYSAVDYEITGERQRCELSDEQDQSHAMWQLHANSRQAGRPNLRVMYGWSDGRVWQATNGPRFAFAGLPVLYKLQLAGPPGDDASDQQPDPCHDFLSRFIADLQPRLIHTTPLASRPL
jgi:hypothetical protein